MRHLKSIFENKEEITEDIIVSCFAYVFDLTNEYDIFESTIEEGDNEYDGYTIDIEHDFYDKSSIIEFKKYLEILNKIDESIEKLEKIYKIDIIRFREISNSSITIDIANR